MASRANGGGYCERARVFLFELGSLLPKPGRATALDWAINGITRAGAENQSIVVVPIAFVSEHSETLVELDIEYAALARRVGVSNYKRVPTLQVADCFISGLSELVEIASVEGERPLAATDRICPASLKLCCKALEVRPASVSKVYCGANNG